MGRIDPAEALRAVRARDTEVVGRLLVGVATTGVCCRPTCPGLVRALDANLRFYSSIEEARAAGYRACRRCRPDGGVVTEPATMR